VTQNTTSLRVEYQQATGLNSAIHVDRTRRGSIVLPYTVRTARLRNSRLRPSRIVVAIALCLGVASCGGESRLAVPASPELSPTSTPLPATPAPAEPVSTPGAPVGAIVWTTAADPETSAPVDSIDAFPDDAPQIVAATTLDAVPAGAQIVATWTYNDTSLDAFTTTLSPPESAQGHWVAFRLERAEDALWPSGTYQVTIAVNGELVESAAVEVIDRS
jgi:hypothetical protein